MSHAVLLDVVCRRLQAVLTNNKSAVSRTPSEYASVYSRRSRLRPTTAVAFGLKPCAPPKPSDKMLHAVAPNPPRMERESATERANTCSRRSRRPMESANHIPKSPSPPCDNSPSPPLIAAHADAANAGDDPIEKWLQEKRRKQVALSKRQERRRQADLKFTARMQERQKDRIQTARLEARCDSLRTEVEGALKALETAWHQEADRARSSSHHSSNCGKSIDCATQHECKTAGDRVCAPLRTQLRQIHADARRCNLGAQQRQRSLEQQLEQLQELQSSLDNAMLAENINNEPSLASPSGLKGLAALATLAKRASARQSPAPLTLDDMADDVEFWSRHAHAGDKQCNAPRPLIRGAMREVMSAYQTVRDNVAWRASIDPTGRHSESLRALSHSDSQLQSPEPKLPSSARARAAARRGQPLTSTRQSIRA